MADLSALLADFRPDAFRALERRPDYLNLPVVRVRNTESFEQLSGKHIFRKLSPIGGNPSQPGSQPEHPASKDFDLLTQSGNLCFKVFGGVLQVFVVGHGLHPLHWVTAQESTFCTLRVDA